MLGLCRDSVGYLGASENTQHVGAPSLRGTFKPDRETRNPTLLSEHSAFSITSTSLGGDSVAAIISAGSPNSHK